MDEGDADIVAAMIGVVTEECRSAGAEPLDESLVGRWLEHRNDVAALQQLISGGLVVDTMEISAPWAALPRIYQATIAAIGGVPGTLSVSAHQSHSYVDGGCLYFTFAGKVEPDERTAFHQAVWDAGVRAVLANGGSLSHHHGVGLHRGPYVRDALGDAFDVIVGLKSVLDPNGILNPGKLGLPDPFAAPSS
jgi:alkyldihydroxyacetonephosphate synthase